MSEFKTVQLKRSNTTGAVPSAAQLVPGELVINLADKKLYSKDNSGTVFSLNTIDDGSVTFAKLASSVLNAIYPVGSIYTNATVNTNPGTLLGFGTWTAFGAGRVMIGFDATNPLFDSAEETGGSADATTVSHTHTFSGTTGTGGGSHSHSISPSAWTAGGGAVDGGAFSFGGTVSSTGSTNIDHTHSFSGTTASTGSSGTNANYQPYITVYMWKRTA